MIVLKLWPLYASLAIMGAAEIGGTPSWLSELVLLPVMAWLALEAIRQGRALKRLPTREDIEGWRKDAIEEHRRLFESLDTVNRGIADNTARIDGLRQRMDAHRAELDDMSAQIRVLGQALHDARED